MSREAEAEKHIKDGKKAASKGLFKKPDWDTAATEYEKAAQIYSLLKHVEEAKGAWQLASDAHYAAENLYFSSRALENISRIYDEQKDFVRAADMLERAAKIYAEDNKPDKQAETLTKAAKALLVDSAIAVANTDRVIGFLNEALGIYFENQLYHLTGEAQRTLVNFLVRSQRFPDAIQAIRNHLVAFRGLKQPHNVHRSFLELIVIHLAMDDYVAADKAYQEASSDTESFRGSDEGSVALDLCSAYDQRDPEQLVEVQKNQILNFLATEVAKLARKLRVTGAPKAATGGGAPGAPAAGDGEEYEENLC
eukprot:TRINITY_DN36208_c0_g1_i1.p1 TRINITY_DN36208_c0_g1~~TRINITY_DN36208_c0_g1_i1.p1  ORF type:complete len:309 (+),score=74.65 TRINITY_DN36208_c0_g1_i1:56-982(+)